MVNSFHIALNGWFTWSRKSINRKIFAAIITVGGFTLVVRLAEALVYLFVANQFGTSDELDAFVIAFLLPSFAIIVLTGAFNASIMPTYIQVREDGGGNAAKRLFSSVMLLSILFFIIISALLAVFAGYVIPILGSGFASEKMDLTRSLFYILVPVLIFSGMAKIWASILNAGEHFALAAFVPIVRPILSVILLLATVKFWGIYALVFGIVGGSVFEAGLLACGIKHRQFSLIPRWHGMDPAVKQVLKQFAPMAAGAFFMGGAELIDQSMAAMLGPGSVSALSYGNKLVMFILVVGSGALGTAVFPHFSRMTAVKDWDLARHTLKSYTRLVLIVTIPLTLMLIYLSEFLVGILFERGAFVAADTRLVGKVQALYLLQVPFYVLGIMGVRLLSAMKKNQTLMVISAINLITNIVGNYVFMSYLGVAGISLSTSVVYAISMSLIFLSLNSELRKQVSNE
jgi:putative peptidoglycan lipid II flippase